VINNFFPREYSADFNPKRWLFTGIKKVEREELKPFAEGKILELLLKQVDSQRKLYFKMRNWTCSNSE